MDTALKVLLGPQATGFSANTISRLKSQWAEEYEDWRKADLGLDEWVYIWADGIYSGLRGADDRLCVLVVIGVNARGEKHFLAIEDGVRESTQSWREVLLALKSRGASTLRSWPRVMVPWGSGRRWRRSTRRPNSNAAGCIKPATS